MNEPRKIAIVRCAALGDIVVLTPVLRKFKKKYPECVVTLVLYPATKDVVDGLPYIDNIVILDRAQKNSCFSLMQKLRHYDTVLFLDWQPRLAFLAFLFGIPNRFGITNKKGKSSFFLSRHVTILDRSSRYETENYAQTFAPFFPIDFSDDIYNLDIALPRHEDIAKVDELLGGTRDYIAIAPFTRLEQRNWPIEYYQGLIERLERTFPVVVIGPADKRQLAEKIGGKNLAGLTNLRQMAEVIRRATLFIGSDSGPMHVAGATKTRQIALFGKANPTHWAPRKNCRVLKLALPCSPCTDEQAKECLTLDCLRNISIDMLYQAVMEETSDIQARTQVKS